MQRYRTKRVDADSPAPLASDGVDEGKMDTLVLHPRPIDDAQGIHWRVRTFIEGVDPFLDRLAHFHGPLEKEDAGVRDALRNPKEEPEAVFPEPVEAARKEQDKPGGHVEVRPVEVAEVLVKVRVGLRRLVAQHRRYGLPLLAIFLSCPHGRPSQGDMGDTVHKACKAQPVDDEDPGREDVEDVGVVVLRPSCKRHEDVQLTPQQLFQPLVALGVLGQGDEALPHLEEVRQPLGGRILPVGSLRHEKDVEGILGRQTLERPRDQIDERALLEQVEGEEHYPELVRAPLRDCDVARTGRQCP